MIVERPEIRQLHILKASSRGETCEFMHSLYTADLQTQGYLSATDIIGLSSFNFTQWAPQKRNIG